jgi:hypothetical protein
MSNIKEIARNVTSAVVAYISATHDDEAANDLDLYIELIEGIELQLLTIADKELGTNRFAIRKEWNYDVQGIECGYSYIAHYAIRLFAEMCDKRWAPKSRLGQVNTLAAQFVRAGKATDKSTAMKLASQRVKRHTTMHGKSIVDDMNILIDTIDAKQSDAIRAYYPSLMVNMQGEHRSRPKDLHIRLVAKMVHVIATITGYN